MFSELFLANLYQFAKNRENIRQLKIIVNICMDIHVVHYIAFLRLYRRGEGVLALFLFQCFMEELQFFLSSRKEIKI